MNAMLKGLHLVYEIEPGSFDWSKVVDESYLPPDLRARVH
jgi:NitT/TauT family transport system substrate-binding protein